jgi:cupin fold WbuC family metalloprotein
MKQIAASQLSELARAAQESPRRRANLNLHETLTDPIQRLAIAMEPDTLIRPHRHPQTWELLIPLRGRFIVLYFDDAGVITYRAVLGDEVSVLETPAGQWHAVLSLDEGGVIFEVKQGPYTPISNGDFAPWGSAEGEPQAHALLSWYASARPGDRLVE